VKTWKAHRDRLFSDTILPVGDVPDGTNWTGFAAFDKARTSGYLLLFRGVGASPDWASPLDAFGKGPHTVQLLGGAGEATVDRGEIRARIPASPGFLWVAIQ
jgi:hypothetical protein